MLGKIQTEESAPFGVALSSVAGIPTEAVDAIWQAGLVTSSTPRLRQPSDKMVDELIASPVTAIEHHALAACLRDSAKLEALIAAHPSVAASAVDNCFLTQDTAVEICGDDPELSSGPIGERTLIPADFSGCDPAQFQSAASSIVLARLAPCAAEMLDAQANGSASTEESGIADEIVDLIITGEDPNAGDHRRFRAAVLDLVDSSTRTKLLIKISEASGLLGTAHDWAGLVDLIDSGIVFEEEVETRVDADAWLWSKMTGNDSYDAFSVFGKSSPSPAGAGKTKSKGPKPVQVDSISDEAELLAMLGYEEVASRTVLDSNSSVSGEELEAALDAADPETVIDWAENRLPRRPLQGDVTAQMIRMGLDRVKELSLEVAKRPDPVEQNPELIIMTPGIAGAVIEPKAARMLAEFLYARLSGDVEWAILASLLGDIASSDTVIEILEAAKQIATAD